jgi:lipopolysaccharide export system permease protein
METPEALFEPFDSPAGFSTGELPRVIRTAEQRHVPVRPLRVEFQSRFAGAALPLVMVLLAVPLGARIQRGGRSAAIALAIGLGIVYFMLFNLSLNLGRVGRLDPAVSAWFANVVFGLVGLELFRRAPT